MGSSLLCWRYRGEHDLPKGRTAQSALVGRGSIRACTPYTAKQNRGRTPDHSAEQRGCSGVRTATAAGGGFRRRSVGHFVFPACENGVLDFTRNQRTFRTAWRSLVREAGMRAGRDAARAILQTGGRISGAKAAWKRAAQAFRRFRFHDLRHQSITEMAEAGVPDAAMQSIAGHLSKKMLDHYSHVRMAAKWQAVEALGGGLIGLGLDVQQAKGKAN